ncbi:MAG: FAD-binding oxidoreductase [Acidimicrobiia bacterium]
MIAASSDLESLRAEVPGAPDSALTVAPASPEEVAMVLRHATENGMTVQVLGGGTHSGYGSPPHPDIVLSTQGLVGVESWEPDDLTMVVGAGVRVADIEAMLAEKSQTAVMPERPGDSTLGGVISTGRSAWRRSRLYSTRERILEVTLVTGDGRLVRAGGRVVKNVTGYDLPRLVVGAFGALGVVVSVCLKLWPVPPSAATVAIDTLQAAAGVVRPLAVLEDRRGIHVFLWGTAAEVEALATRLGGEASQGHDWPADPSGPFRWSLRVPPALVAEGIDRLPDHWDYVASHGVGELRAASSDPEGAGRIRDWAEGNGGALVMVDAPPEARDGLDPWGTPPPAFDVQRRLIAQFDPGRVINPGRLPGGL